MFGSNTFVGDYIIAPIENLRKKIYSILVSERNTNPTGQLFNFVIVGLIIINIAAIILETVHTLYNDYKLYFDVLEIYTLTIFTIEYFLQVWICTFNPKYKHPLWGRLRFMITPMPIIELLVILPLFITIISHYDLRYLAILRFVMVLRIFRLNKYSDALKAFIHVFEDKKEELILTFISILILLVITSCTMYYIEKDVNKDFSSIPETMWWAASTLTTVGYGDVVPVTPVGKLLGSLIAIMGIAMFAIPAGLISSSFTDLVQSRKKKKKCPHCGEEL